jgi:transcriptional regulator with XRE-family HTH domain
MTPLRAIRLRTKKTLQDVAAAVDSTPGSISRLERGKQKASPDLAAKLVEFFGSGAIGELQILYPERFPVREKRGERRKERADVAGAARG